jgi:hypothetical protein
VPKPHQNHQTDQGFFLGVHPFFGRFSEGLILGIFSEEIKDFAGCQYAPKMAILGVASHDDFDVERPQRSSSPPRSLVTEGDPEDLGHPIFEDMSL